MPVQVEASEQAMQVLPVTLIAAQQMPPGPGPVQVTPEVAAAQLVADVWQGATEGEAEQAMILEDESEMSMVVAELMMVTDPALELMQKSLPWREKKEEKASAEEEEEEKRNNKKTTTNQNIGVREDEKKKKQNNHVFCS